VQGAYHADIAVMFVLSDILSACQIQNTRAAASGGIFWCGQNIVEIILLNTYIGVNAGRGAASVHSE
jgi:hypothetical protein